MDNNMRGIIRVMTTKGFCYSSQVLGDVDLTDFSFPTDEDYVDFIEHMKDYFNQQSTKGNWKIKDSDWQKQKELWQRLQNMGESDNESV